MCNISRFYLVTHHVKYMAVICAPGGDTAAESEAGKGGEGAK